MRAGVDVLSRRKAPANGETRNQPSAKGSAVRAIWPTASRPAASLCERLPTVAKTRNETRSPATNAATRQLPARAAASGAAGVAWGGEAMSRMSIQSDYETTCGDEM